MENGWFVSMKYCHKLGKVFGPTLQEATANTFWVVHDDVIETPPLVAWQYLVRIPVDLDDF